MPEGNPPNRCPVAFDHHSPEHAKSWPEAYQKLRKDSPRAWSESYGGHWVASKYEDIIKIAQRPEKFYVAKTVDHATGRVDGGVAIPPNPAFAGIPNEADSPQWDAY